MARRGWGEGSICDRTVRRRLKDGTVAEYVYHRAIVPGGPGGRRLEYQSRSEKRARAWLREQLGRRERGLPAQGRNSVTLGAYAVDWLRHTSARVRPATTEFYRASLRHLEPLAAQPIASLTPARVRELVTENTDAGRSSRTVRGIVQTLSLVLRQAHEDGLVDRNVAAMIRLPKLEQAQRSHFTAEQVRRFLDAARTDVLYSLYAVALGTGLRRGELLALTWREIDLGAADVVVRRGKTAAAARRVPLPEFAAVALAGVVHGTGRIWPYRPEYVTRHFQALCRAAGVPVLTFHELRHTWFTLMAEAGVSEEVRQWLGGHEDRQMTRHYSHESQALMRAAADRLSGTIAGTSPAAVTA